MEVLASYKKKFRVYGAVYDNILINIVRSLSLGISYGIVETYVPLEQIPVYRIIYIFMLVFPFISRNIYLWIGDAVLCMFIQDLTYWLYIGQKPVQWAWYYPVIDHFPLLYPIAIIIVVFCYYKAYREGYRFLKTT